MEPRHDSNDLGTTRAPSQADWHAFTPDQRRRVLDALRGFSARSGRRVYVASEVAVHHPAARRFVPDLLVAFDVDPHARTK
jgi:hypothetical protein